MQLHFIDMPSPVGRLKLVANSQALVAVMWENEQPKCLDSKQLLPCADHPILLATQKQLSEYFAGQRQHFDLPLTFEGVDAATATAEITKARTEFLAATEVLRNAPEATARIREELQLADGQWVFFDSALKRLQPGTSGKPLSDVFVASENLLAVMDRVTGLYSAIKS